MRSRFVSYLRVSTRRQGESGLGLEAQRKAVEDYLNGGDWELMEEYVEIESGKKSERPELHKALKHARVTGSTVIVAKLDRLSRNAAFLLALQDSGVQFVCADMPEANNFTVGIMALVAQQEREAISRRTREALKAAKARGTKLGNPNGAAALRRANKGNVAAVATIQQKAQDHAEDLREVVDAIRSDGVASIRGIAQELNARGMRTPRGGEWHPTSAARLLKRLNA